MRELLRPFEYEFFRNGLIVATVAGERYAAMAAPSIGRASSSAGGPAGAGGSDASAASGNNAGAATTTLFLAPCDSNGQITHFVLTTTAAQQPAPIAASTKVLQSLIALVYKLM